jgi:hypothetical protein
MEYGKLCLLQMPFHWFSFANSSIKQVLFKWHAGNSPALVAQQP